MRKRLLEARKNLGLTQAKVSERLKKPQSYLSKVESGERCIDPIELLRFAEIYGREIMWFLRDDELPDGLSLPE